MSSFFRRNGVEASNSSSSPHVLGTSNVGQVSDGDLKYVAEIGGNTSEVGFQEASGAPVETKSPLGYSVGPVTILFLNLSMMVGTGIFSTCKHIVSIALAPHSLGLQRPPFFVAPVRSGYRSYSGSWDS